jgi:hypothetical protein
MISTKYIVRRRGDTKRIRVCVKTLVAAEDISGASFKLTVNSLPYPGSAVTQIFQVFGDVVDPTNGIVEFPIQDGNEDISGFFFFDVEMADPAGTVDTILFGWYHVKQDITKDSDSLVIDSSSHGVSNTEP